LKINAFKNKSSEIEELKGILVFDHNANMDFRDSHSSWGTSLSTWVQTNNLWPYFKCLGYFWKVQFSFVCPFEL